MRVNCPRCKRSFKNTRGLQLHGRSKLRCIPFVEEEAVVVASKQEDIPAPEPTNSSRDFLPRFMPKLKGLCSNWLYYTAIHKDTRLQPIDDESNHVVHRNQVPDEALLAVDENERPRNKKSHQGVIVVNYVEEVIEAVYRWLFSLFNLLFHEIWMVGGVFLIWYILFCHEGQCSPSHTAEHYRSDLSRLVKTILIEREYLVLKIIQTIKK